MARRFRKKNKYTDLKIGLPPGSLKLVGQQESNPTIEFIQYDESFYEITQVSNVDEIKIIEDGIVVNWIKIVGLNATVVESIGKKFGFHNLMLEDILNTEQRPKTDDFKDYIFFVLKKNVFESSLLCTEQISFILTKNCVISFEEKKSNSYAPIVERIVQNQGYIRSNKSDYLLYALIDITIDNYFVLIDMIDESIEKVRDLSEMALDNNKPLLAIRRVKDDLNYLRKYILPTKEAVYKLERLETDLIGESTDKFLRDLYDHINIISENLELYKDTLMGIREDYISNINLKMNNVIQLLTIVSSVFIPLTFIAGVYGMNFKHMPELENYYGYYYALAFMVVVAVALFIYYKIKKWV